MVGRGQHNTRDYRPSSSARKRNHAEEPSPQLLGLIKQYLHFHNFNRTVECLSLDASNAGVRISEPASDGTHASFTKILHLFRSGDRVGFMSEFSSLVPREHTLLDRDCVLLLFDLQLHFLVVPLAGARPDLARFREEHTHFVRYLEQTASINQDILNSSCARFLCLGLSSVLASPLDNFLVRELLAHMHVTEARMTRYLRGVVPARDAPTLAVLLGEKERAQQLEGKCVRYRSLYQRQQQEYFNVLGVATELVESLENAILGKGVDPGTIERVCAQLFGANQSLPDLTRPGTASNALRQSVVLERAATQVPQSAPKLDVARVKQELLNGEGNKPLYLLQALRWRLTKSSEPAEREELVSLCVQGDLYGNKDIEYSSVLLDRYLSENTDTLPLESFVRLVHCFCALSAGCVHLSKHRELVEQLLTCLISSQSDDVIRQVVLGALQTLSLTRAVQDVMLANSRTMDWLLTLLSDPDELSEFTLHHTCALLMNLCLRTAGRIHLSHHTTLLFTVVEGLLEHDSSLVREYVNGILFSALSMSEVREKARETGLDESLKLLIGISPGDTAHQLQYCLDQLCSPGSGEDPELGESEDEEEEVVEDNVDSLSMDLQLPETLDPPRGGLQGEELLCGVFTSEMKLRLPSQHSVPHIPPTNQPRSGAGRMVHSPQPQGDGTTNTPPSQANRMAHTPPNKVKQPQLNNLNTTYSNHDASNGSQPSGLGPGPKQQGPGSNPNFPVEEDEFVTNPDDRPIKPAKQPSYGV